jgi:hypothetical protein
MPGSPVTPSPLWHAPWCWHNRPAATAVREPLRDGSEN